ncbi:MAG: hypothetical protein PHE01_01775 [Methanosarcina sp.]|jgi:hypothetical protein|nr:hypothetical protein [Methanosarcina sp.]
MKPQRVEINIEKLVLEGFERADRHLIGEAVEQELARLFAEQGVPPGLEMRGNIARLEGATVTIAPGLEASNIGVNIAKSVYGGLGSERKNTNSKMQ